PVPLFRPVPGLANAACLLPTAMRRGLLSVALRALRTIPFAACRYVGQVVNLRGGWPIANRPQIHNLLHKGCASGDYLVVTVASPARRPSPVAVIFTRPALPRSPRTINRAKPLNALRWSAWKDSTVAALPLSTPAILAGPSRANFTRLSAVGQK